jgi:hypothetical protein
MLLGNRAAANNPPREADVFLGDRRWILGQRHTPLRLERVEKLPRSGLTSYARSGAHSVTVTDGTHIRYPITSTKVVEHTVPHPIAGIAIAPYDGYFLLALREPNSERHLFKLLNNKGDLVDVADHRFVVVLTSLHWIATDTDLYLLCGTQLGQIIELTIRPNDRQIPLKWIYYPLAQMPITTITSIHYKGLRHVVVGTWHSLDILSAPAPHTDLKLVNAIEPHGSRHKPSFVATNGSLLAWLTYADLQVFTYEQLFEEDPQTTLTRPFNELRLEMRPELWLIHENSRMIMSSYYVILSSPTAVVGISVADCTVSFTFPFPGSTILLPLC